MRAFLFVLLSVAMFASFGQAQSESRCQYYGKDYDSPGFGIPYRSGFFVRARFGCNYRCVCPNGEVKMSTYVLEEKHFDVNVFTKATGGPHAAKWFICPNAVKPNTWQPLRDEFGRVIAYNVEINHDWWPTPKSGPLSNMLSLCDK